MGIRYREGAYASFFSLSLIIRTRARARIQGGHAHTVGGEESTPCRVSQHGWSRNSRSPNEAGVDANPV